jgi:uncharacterized protein YecT (DUF1311 family)
MIVINIRFILFIIFLFTIDFSITQEPYVLSEEELLKFDDSINNNAEVLRLQLLKELENPSKNRELEIEFQVDRFKIIQNIQKRTEEYVNPFGQNMNKINSFEEIEYDKLLNKYYQKLLNKLKEPDKETLRQAQRNWIKFRDSEIKLIDIIYSPNYSGPGFLPILSGSSTISEHTKNRTIEIYNLLLAITLD